ncbi:MAG: hypothetical protein MI861_23430 [Pirellulales bacterium]|nr:hypothetical protein [Pirellulales bacterium]
MKTWIDRILLLALLVATGALSASAAPWLLGGHVEGRLLLVHMAASGALVITLPLFAISYLLRSMSRFRSGRLQRLGYWSLVLAGVITIATVFACMLPLAPTELMRELIRVHGYAGFAMVPALLLLIWGSVRWRRIQAMRSATEG